MASKRSSAVHVYIRTRPTANFSREQISIDESLHRIQLVHREDVHGDRNYHPSENKRDTWKFQFERILHNAPQSIVYETAAEKIVHGCVEGSNGTVMAYGQTGSGKTFTMTGDTENYKNRGIIPRALAQVFAEVAERHEVDFRIKCSYAEIYNERIYDLLDEDTGRGRTEHTLKEDAKTRRVFVQGLTMKQVESEEEALNLLFMGERNRTTAEHQLNKNSNRSHAVFTVHIEQTSKVRSEEVRFSKLNLVDLAGSERLKKTLHLEGEAVDMRLKRESMYINKSLSYLEQVVVALTSKSRSHIPYRQTKLTNLLKDSIGGNCSTALIACIWGEATHIEETISTLKLAQRMARVRNLNAKEANVIDDPQTLIKRQQRQIRELKQELMMHDALANRSGVSYSELTPEECAEIAKQIDAFVSALPEDQEKLMMDPVSVQQIKECFRQLKARVVNAEKQVEARLRKEFAFTAKKSNNNSESAMDPAQLPEVEEGEGFVGEEEEGEGYVLGEAPPGMAPPEVEEKSYREEKSVDLVEDHEPAGNVTGNTEEVEIQQVPTDKEEAFQMYIREDKEGATKREELRELSVTLQERLKAIQSRKAAYKEAQEELRAREAKLSEKTSERRGEKEEKKVSFQRDEEEIIDEEEFILMKRVGELKRDIRQQHEALQVLRNERVEMHGRRDVVKMELLRDFQLWYAQHALTEEDDLMDDGEMFEKLQIERVMAEDPQSVAFFRASKAATNKSRHRKPKKHRL